MKMKNMFAVLGLATAVVLTSCGGDKKKAEDEAARKKREADSLAQIEQARQDSLAKLNEVKVVNVVETAKGNADLSTLVELISAAGLVDKLSDETANFTVFAPTNAAFATIKDLEDLKTNVKRKQELTDILTYHVVSGKFGSGDLKEGNELDALDEKVIKVTMKDGSLAVGGAKVTTADVQATNGIIHIVDAVMTPPKKKGKATNKPTVTTTTTGTSTTQPTTTTVGNGTVTGRGTTGTGGTVTGRGNTTTGTTTTTTTVTGRGNK